MGSRKRKQPDASDPVPRNRAELLDENNMAAEPDLTLTWKEQNRIPTEKLFDKEHSVAVGNEFQQLRKQSPTTSDVKIYGAESHSRGIHCHKHVVSFISKYFETHFESPLYDGTDVHLDLISDSILNSVVEFAYTSRVSIDGFNALPLFQAADFLDSHHLRDAVLCFFTKNLSMLDGESCFKITRVLPKSIPLWSSFRERTFSGAKEIFDTSDGSFPDLTYEEMKDFLASDQLNLGSEDEVLETVRMWASIVEGRVVHIPSLLKRLRLPLLKRDILMGLSDSFPKEVRSTELENAVAAAVHLQDDPEYPINLFNHKDWAPRMQDVAFGCVYIVKKRNDSVSTVFVDINRRDVRDLPDIEYPRGRDIVYAQILTLDDYLYILSNTRELMPSAGWRSSTQINLHRFDFQKSHWTIVIPDLDFPGGSIKQGVFFNGKLRIFFDSYKLVSINIQNPLANSLNLDLMYLNFEHRHFYVIQNGPVLDRSLGLPFDDMFRSTEYDDVTDDEELGTSILTRFSTQEHRNLTQPCIFKSLEKPFYIRRDPRIRNWINSENVDFSLPMSMRFYEPLKVPVEFTRKWSMCTALHRVYNNYKKHSKT